MQRLGNQPSTDSWEKSFQKPSKKETKVNLTIDSGTNNWRRHLSLQQIGLGAAGLALAFSVGVVVGNSTRGTEYVASAPAVAPVARSVSAADLAASVLSTEEAQLGVPAFITETHSVSPEDLAASVLSSDSTHFIE